MLKVILLSILIVLTSIWWIEEFPKLHATRLAAEEMLINNGYMPNPGRAHPADGYPQYDGLQGLLERGDPEDGSARFLRVFEDYYFPQPVEEVSTPLNFPRYDGVQGLIERGDGNETYPVYDKIHGYRDWAYDAPGETYALTPPNQTQKTEDKKISTFSVDVDTASYSNIRRLIREDKEIPPHAVRVEEMINYFHYDYAHPAGNDPIAIQTNVGSCPWNGENRLVQIGLQARDVQDKVTPPLNLVMLVDVSGSMESPDKLPLLKAALREFVSTLRKEDRLSMVVYAGAAKVVLRPTSGKEKIRLENAVMSLNAEGSTNGAQGILTAYDLARENFDQNSVNRVILATDGDFNVGLSNTRDLLSLIRGQKHSGIYLTVLGLGTGNIDDHLMEQLADTGNGIYAYLDSLSEARRVLQEQAGSSFVPVADDVKVQVEFHSELVQSYRQVGYENRQLENRDFTNDRKDAGEMGAGHQVTALYEVKLARPLLPLEPVGTVSIRFKKPGERDSRLLKGTLSMKPWEASDALHFASLVAELGLYLKYAPKADIERVYSALRNSPSLLDSPERKEFQTLVDDLYLRKTEKAR